MEVRTSEFQVSSALMAKLALRVVFRQFWFLFFAYPFIGFALTKSALEEGHPVAAIVGGLMATMPLVMVMQRRSRLVRQSIGSMGVKVRLTITGQAIEIWTDNEHFKTWDWSLFLGSRNLGAVMVIATPDGGVVLVPEAALESQEDRGFFENQLRTKLSVGGVRPDAIGAIP